MHDIEQASERKSRSGIFRLSPDSLSPGDETDFLYLLVVVGIEEMGMVGQPAHGEDQDDHQKHLHHLKTCKDARFHPRLSIASTHAKLIRRR